MPLSPGTWTFPQLKLHSTVSARNIVERGKIPAQCAVWFSERERARRARMPLEWNSRCVYAISSALHAHVAALWSHSFEASSSCTSITRDNVTTRRQLILAHGRRHRLLLLLLRPLFARSWLSWRIRRARAGKTVRRLAIKRWRRIIDNLDSG